MATSTHAQDRIIILGADEQFSIKTIQHQGLFNNGAKEQAVWYNGSQLKINSPADSESFIEEINYIYNDRKENGQINNKRLVIDGYVQTSTKDKKNTGFVCTFIISKRIYFEKINGIYVYDKVVNNKK